MRIDVEEALHRYKQAQELRFLWDTHWSDLARYLYPEADDFINQRSEGQKRSRLIFDAVPSLSNEKFAAAMQAMLTPANQTYQRLRATDEDLAEDPEIIEWMEHATRVLMKVRASPRSGFYPQVHEGYKSIGAFGNQCMYVEEVPARGIRYKHCAVSDVWVAQNHLRQVDTIYYRYHLSAKAATQRWQDNAPPSAKTATNAFAPIEFVHVVAPNLQIEPDRLDAAGRAWISADICVKDKLLVESGFFDELPYIYSRYTLNPGETYGRSPAMLVLPSIKTLQEMQKTLLRSAHKAADPPLLLRSDAVLGQGMRAPRLFPGGLNFGGLDAAGREMVKPLITGARPEITIELMERERLTIEDAFLVPLFRLVSEHPNMTATEVLMRAQEKALAIGPTIFRQQSEFLGPLTHRELQILLRQGLVRRPPERFLQAGAEYEVEYESMMVRHQRMDEVLALQRTIEVLAPLIQTNPSLLEIIDADKAFRLVARLQGVPEDILRNPDELAKIRQGIAAAEEEQRALEAAPQVAKVVGEIGRMRSGPPIPVAA